MINIAVLGFGTVGSGVYDVIKGNQQSINKRVDDEVNIKYILDIKDFAGTEVEQLITNDFEEILNDEEVKVVAEVMGGLEPAYTFVKQSLLKGKHVVTSNKELVARFGPELIEIAKVKGVNFLFEASVGGGIPVIRPFISSLVADEVTDIKGILNGTTNFMLTKMERDGMSFDAVLKEAQALGYAERNPEADVEGFDACRKIAILTSLANGKFVDFEDVYTEGITNISTADMQYAKALNKTIKLLGVSKKVDDATYAYVAPVMLESNHQLSHIHDVFNGVFVTGNMVNDLMFYGSGAGKLPTASAVCTDVINAIQNMDRHLPIEYSSEKLEIAPFESLPMTYFVRVKATDDAKVLVEATFGSVEEVSIDLEEVAFVSQLETEGSLAKKVDILKEKGLEVVSIIRVDA